MTPYSHPDIGEFTPQVYNPVVTYYDYTAAKAALVGLTRTTQPLAQTLP